MIRSTQPRSTVVDTAEQFQSARQGWLERAFSGVSNLYKAAKVGRFSPKLNGSASGSSADQHYSSEQQYFRMVELGRMFDRDDMIAGAIVNRLVDNVIQRGFSYDPKTGDKQADAILKARFSAYESRPSEVDVASEHDLHTLARMLFRDCIVSGDIFALKTKSMKLQTIENHRCRTPVNMPGSDKKMCIHGVELDGFRKRLAYWFTQDDIALNGTVTVANATRVLAKDAAGNKNVLHIYHPRRVTQTRGVTKFAPVTEGIAIHGDIQFAKLVQQQQVSCWGIVRQRQLGFEMPDNVLEPFGTVEDPCRPGQTRSLMNVSPGMMYTGYPGEQIGVLNAQVPSPTFFDHAKQIQQLIGINLDIPLVMLLLDASETNFSGFRGALEQAKLSFVALQDWFAKTFYREVAMWQIRQWSDPNSPFADPFIVDLRERGINVFAHGWVLPTWPYIQPVEDATADVIKLRSGMTSLRRAHSARGNDYDTVLDEMIQDRKAMIIAAKQAAAEINDAFPDDKDPAHWRDLAPLPPSEGETLALPSVEPERMQKDKGAATNGQQAPAK